MGKSSLDPSMIPSEHKRVIIFLFLRYGGFDASELLQKRKQVFQTIFFSRLKIPSFLSRLQPMLLCDTHNAFERIIVRQSHEIKKKDQRRGGESVFIDEFLSEDF